MNSNKFLVGTIWWYTAMNPGGKVGIIQQKCSLRRHSPNSLIFPSLEIRVMRLWTCAYETRAAFTPDAAEILLAPHAQRPRQSTPLRQNSSALCDSDDRRGSLCESDVKTAHISATVDTLYLDCPLVPGDITIKEHTKIKDGSGVFMKRLPKSTKEKWGPGEEGDRRMKIMVSKKYKIHQQSYGHCFCTEAGRQI